MSEAVPATGKQIAAPLQSLIGGRILALREQRVMLDADLAELYGVQTKVLVQAVKRNLARFPQDFMFQLSADEFAALRSQTVTSNTGRGGRRTPPYAFTEQGVAILSSVLGTTRDEFLDSQKYSGNAFTLMRWAECFFIDLLPVASKIGAEKMARVALCLNSLPQT
jgi:hypothetical protein